jgi:hypothetical protein
LELLFRGSAKPCFLLVQLTAVHLVDSHLCSDAEKYVGALLLSLSTMLHLELPHINILSKIDLIESYGKLGNVSVPGLDFDKRFHTYSDIDLQN